MWHFFWCVIGKKICHSIKICSMYKKVEEKNKQKKERKIHNTKEHWIICALTFFSLRLVTRVQNRVSLVYFFFFFHCFFFSFFYRGWGWGCGGCGGIRLKSHSGRRGPTGPFGCSGSFYGWFDRLIWSIGQGFAFRTQFWLDWLICLIDGGFCHWNFVVEHQSSPRLARCWIPNLERYDAKLLLTSFLWRCRSFDSLGYAWWGFFYFALLLVAWRD